MLYILSAWPCRFLAGILPDMLPHCFPDVGVAWSEIRQLVHSIAVSFAGLPHSFATIYLCSPGDNLSPCARTTSPATVELQSSAFRGKRGLRATPVVRSLCFQKHTLGWVRRIPEAPQGCRLEFRNLGAMRSRQHIGIPLTPMSANWFTRALIGGR